MNRISVLLGAVLGIALTTGPARAAWGEMAYSGYQPWWHIHARRYKCLTPEEERLQKFWHDYYHALKTYYAHLDRIDYKNHGHRVNAGCANGSCGRVNYAPVSVAPPMQWAVPTGVRTGPPVGPPRPPGR